MAIALFLITYLGVDLGKVPGLVIDRVGIALLGAIAMVGCGVVSTQAAVMLLIPFMNPLTPQQWYVLALASTFAGNLFVLGSIANLIVIEQASRLGVVITFREHARVGVPVTLMSLIVLVLWGML